MIADENAQADAMPLVSIVITVFDRLKYIDQAIRSALGQTYPHIQVIVVDDGSRTEIGASIAPYTDRIEFYRQDNAGMASARNLGMRQARGRFLLFLDDDDYLEFQAVEFLLRGIEQGKCLAWAAGGFRYVDDMGRSERGPRFFQGGVGDVYWEMIERCCISCPSAVLVRAEVLRAVGGFDESIRLSEDYDLWLKLARDHALVFTEEIVTNYRTHPGQNSRTGWERHYESHLRVLREHEKRARPGSEARFREAIASVCFQYADSLDYHHQPQAARAYWRQSLAERGKNSDSRIVLRIIKSYIPSTVRRSLRGVRVALLSGRTKLRGLLPTVRPAWKTVGSDSSFHDTDLVGTDQELIAGLR